MTSHKLHLLLWCLLYLKVATCQTTTERVNPSSIITSWVQKYPPEKAYLQFDKPYYAAGDTIYFKAYLTLGESHRLSDLSGVLHVDLINTNNQIDHSLKLQVKNGVAWGDFPLPDSLPGGNYHVTGYTRWMQNEGNDAFFEQTIPIASLQKPQIPESVVANGTTTNSKPDIQFFPEGGNLVADVPSRVAFKAVAAGGAGIGLKGELIDSDHKTILAFASTHLGMGSFYFTPGAGKTYKAQITYADGSIATSDLPVAQERGILLAVNNDSVPKATVKIIANQAYFNENKNKPYTLLIWSGGTVNSVPCTLDSSMITLDILKRRLKTGVATVTLLSPDNQPLCERLFFVQNYDQLNIHVASDKQSYAKREKVNLQFHIKTRADSAAMGHFSVSVTDEAIVPVDENDENSILTDLLLTSNLKGYIEQPNYYFINPSPQTNVGLDLVMLTHGYRRFEWKKILSNEYPPIAYQPEKALEISGIEKTFMGKPINNGTVTLIPLTGGPLLRTHTDSQGQFQFSDILFADSTRFELSATNAKGSNLTQLLYERNKDQPPVLLNKDVSATPTGYNTLFQQAYLNNTEKQQEQFNMEGLGKGKLLKQVNIKARKIEPIAVDDRYGSADQVITGDQIRYGGSLAVRLMGLAHGIHFVGSGNEFWPVLNRSTTGSMLIVWNGQEMPADFNLISINTGTIESIEIITNATTPNGVLIIKTNFGTQLKDVYSKGVLSIYAQGFYKAREFYSPKYDHPDGQLKRADLRSTIYWQPELVIGKDGNASLSFYNADGAGNYRVVIEGIDDKGNLGRQVFRYKVE